MTARQQWLVVAVIVGVLGTGLLIASRSMKKELAQVTTGSTAPDFRAKVLNQSKYKTLADYKGQVVLLNIWATWCPPCRAELPSLEKLYKEYGSSGLKLVAVSIDQSVSEDSIRKFADNFGLTFEILHDTAGTVEAQYQTTGYPMTFIIGREGTIRRRWLGPDDWTSQGNRSLIAQLLGIATPRVVGDAKVSAALPVPDGAKAVDSVAR
jgi:cytochrome c biogenesis protein CcmG, thiol:disulfide interchange protein DsbE